MKIVQNICSIEFCGHNGYDPQDITGSAGLFDSLGSAEIALAQFQNHINEVKAGNRHWLNDCPASMKDFVEIHCDESFDFSIISDWKFWAAAGSKVWGQS